ncbi:hypothetical protein ERO13_D03G145100v2 [Gossypium hirsutum]|uniref:non-specific serine/threonine protein kinase n=1 Tax=Gossypium hirsutum TaxID=3635 RepID=A0A1U8LG20_GOSHI|nr:CBL-interacting serine/threonine-protein kinase 11 [Gossypium hirsutum]KAG4155988.1 hypothetical protein ERO13_D03G145100v2 [Gossypium hirsutum]
MLEIGHAPGNALFGKYEIGRLLGCGAFAKVYHARNLRTGLSVAVKVINKKKLPNLTMMSNVKREISIMSRLNHPYIVKLYEVLATKTKIYVVMEFVKGGELFAKVAKGRFTEDFSRKYFQQLISAVGYCHSRGIFHRDLKPENLLLDDNGNLKVSDFGLSAVTDQIRADGMLHTLCGTPAYVAPEILSKKGYDGAKVDVWSCGVILFVMNAGYLPFNDPNLMAMYRKIYNGEFRCPKWMSSDMKRFISRLLETNPVTRISLDEILKDPWFRKGYKEPKFHEEQPKDDAQASSSKLNAFDLISFSSGLNLSGLLDESHDYGERFILRESPEKLVEKVEQLGKGERLKVKKKKQWGVELEGKEGISGVAIEVYQLTDELVVVETKRTGSDAQWYKELWNNRLRPALVGN